MSGVPDSGVYPNVVTAYRVYIVTVCISIRLLNLTGCAMKVHSRILPFIANSPGSEINIIAAFFTNSHYFHKVGGNVVKLHPPPLVICIGWVSYLPWEHWTGTLGMHGKFLPQSIAGHRAVQRSQLARCQISRSQGHVVPS